jgi:hypothetical protein
MTAYDSPKNICSGQSGASAHPAHAEHRNNVEKRLTAATLSGFDQSQRSVKFALRLD